MKSNRKGQADVQVAGCVFQIIVVVVAIVILALVGGSFRTQVTYPLRPAAQGRTVQFSETLTSRHWLGGLIKGEQPDLRQALAKYTAGGDEVGEISVDTRHTFGNCVVSLITLGIYCPVTVTVSGKVVASQAPAAKKAADVAPPNPEPKAAKTEEPKLEKKAEPPAKSPFSDTPPEATQAPKKEEARTWTDVSGAFRVEAEFAGISDNAVQLKKADGKRISVPLDRLSKEDQDWVRDHQR